MQQGRRRQPGMGLMLLFYQLFGVIGIENIPPVTLGCIGLQVAVFLRMFKLPWYNASEVCIGVYKVWRKKQFFRLLYGAFEHGDDWHLYYNMFSFALKGQSLERRFGSLKFLYLISCFTILTNIVLVALGVLASEHFGYNEHTCAIGFSGVIFALKVLTTHHDQNHAQHIMGIPIVLPAKYAVWLELILIQIMVPNVSFFGHLAGILVGMAYVNGPLKYLMDLLYSVVSGIISPASQNRFVPRAERSGYRQSETFSQYAPTGMTEEEQLRMAMEESMQESSQSHSTGSVPPYSSSRHNTGSVPPFSSSSTFSQPSSSSVPPYPNNFTRGGSIPPPPGFIFDQDGSAPPPAGFSPDIEELRNRRKTHFT